MAQCGKTSTDLAQMFPGRRMPFWLLNYKGWIAPAFCEGRQKFIRRQLVPTFKLTTAAFQHNYDISQQELLGNICAH